MTASSLLTAAPSYAALIWVDGNSIYTQIPSQNGPYVMAFTRNTIGLAKALATLFVLHEVEGHGDVYVRPQLPSSIPDKNGITDQQRQDARDILRKLRII